MTDTVEMIACPIVPEIATPAICDKDACLFNAMSFKGRPGCLVRMAVEVNNVGFASADDDTTDKKTSAGVPTPERKAALMGSQVGRTRNQVEVETEKLHQMAAHFREALDTPSQHTGECPNCGYLRPCSIKSTCIERYDILEPTALALEGTLSRFQIWTAVKKNQASFLQEDLQRALKDLLAARDA